MRIAHNRPIFNPGTFFERTRYQGFYRHDLYDFPSEKPEYRTPRAYKARTQYMSTASSSFNMLHRQREKSIWHVVEMLNANTRIQCAPLLYAFSVNVIPAQNMAGL